MKNKNAIRILLVALFVVALFAVVFTTQRTAAKRTANAEYQCEHGCFFSPAALILSA
jgi:hypothetical protein